MNMMMSQVQVPSYPPPFYNQPHMQGAGPYFNASNSDFYPQPSPADYSAGYQGQPSNLSVFNPTAQVYVPTQPDHSHVYKAPPPFTNQAQSKGFTNSKTKESVPNKVWTDVREVLRKPISICS